MKNGEDLVWHLTLIKKLLEECTQKELWDNETHQMVFHLDNFLAECSQIQLTENWDLRQDQEKYFKQYWQFIRFFANSKRVYTQSKHSLLHFAVERCHVLLDDLLLGGADPNACDINGETPLHIAAKTNWFVLITPLIAAGADINREVSLRLKDGSINKLTPRMYAARNNHRFSVTLLDDMAYYLIEKMSISCDTSRKMSNILNWSGHVLNGESASPSRIILNYQKSDENSSEFYHYICTAQSLCELYSALAGLINIPTKSRNIVDQHILSLFNMCGWTTQHLWDPAQLDSISKDAIRLISLIEKVNVQSVKEPLRLSKNLQEKETLRFSGGLLRKAKL